MKTFSFHQLAGLIITVLASIFLGCNKEGNKHSEPAPDINKRGSIILKFDNVVGDKDLVLGAATYKNASNEDFTVDVFQYYISNIKLKTNDGREYIVPQDESYFLVREHVAASQRITISNVPEGDYVEVTFTIGVDSLRSTMPIERRTGVLDIADSATGKPMYWTWNSGYIFVKIEGTSPQSSYTRPSDGQRRFFYHVGGFGGYSSVTVNNIRTTTLRSPEPARVRSNKTPSVHILVDVLKIFSGSYTVSFATNPYSHFSVWSSNLANNYVNMFKIDHVHNVGGHTH
ncbi:MAG: hypothetical protein NZM38_04145 [Cytophagales bacterium]|nr:hypothetical protein [Cytophagales bacterium]MDW8383942.1 hypothetical protein [Flammeovirgaceae bacterium]